MANRRISREDWAPKLHALGYRSARERAVDFTSDDGSFVVEVLERPRAAVRDLHAKLFQIATSIANDRRISEHVSSWWSTG
jgi:hypothetical protein